jgi:EmrB/QacA subfamily drug resistance transporter
MAHPLCDAANAVAADACAVGSTHPRLVLLTTILASSLASIDGSVVNVGLPAIGRDLHGGAGDLQWVVNFYLLPLSALLLLGGALGDRFGRRRLLVVGIALFALASVICALSPTLPSLIFARGLQGIGAARRMPNSLAILGNVFSGAARGQAIGIWAAAGAATSAIGPVLGGGLIDSVGWRAIFLLNVPLAAGAIWLAMRFIDAQPREAAKAPLDWAGAIAATFALAASTWGLTIGSSPQGWTAFAIVAIVAGACLLAAFIWLEKRRGDDALMPLALFGSRSFVGLSLLTLLLYGALGGLLVLLPYVLIQAAGYSATQAGAALLPLPLVMAIVSPIIGGVAGRLGPRLPLSAGPAIMAAGCLLALRIDAASSYWTTILPAMLVISLGMATAVAPLTTAVLTSVDARHTGSASGLNSALARTGGLIATALIGAVLAERAAMLIDGFHIATLVCAIAAASAGLCAFALIEKTNARADVSPKRTGPA